MRILSTRLSDKNWSDCVTAFVKVDGIEAPHRLPRIVPNVVEGRVMDLNIMRSRCVKRIIMLPTLCQDAIEELLK